MRVRTAKVELHRLPGLEAFFEHAVARHFAWAVGIGHFYKDLPDVADKHGYTVHFHEAVAEEEPDFWLAIHKDLLVDGSTASENGRYLFDTTPEGLGLVSVGFDNFEVVNQEDRVRQVGSRLDLDSNYTCTEFLYRIQPLKS